MTWHPRAQLQMGMQIATYFARTQIRTHDRFSAEVVGATFAGCHVRPSSIESTSNPPVASRPLSRA